MKDKLLIIGGTGDIAKGIIEEYSSRYDILITYRNKNKLNEVKNNILESFNLDLKKDEKCKIKDTITEIFKKHSIKKVILANGLMINNLLITSSDEEIEDLIFNNLEVNILILRELIKKLIKLKKELKNIVVLSSLAGDVGNAGQAVYSTTKGSITPLVKSLSREYASKGIIVNSLSLGIVDHTDMKKTIPVDKLMNIVEHIPLQRFCHIKDIVKSLDFLLETEYLTGQNIKLNGGFI